jgi:lauroyl/myristoyl acyltransferase
MASVSLKTFLHPRRWYAWPVLALMLIMSWMPSRVLWGLGICLGSIASWFHRQSPICERNIELCFPKKSRRTSATRKTAFSVKRVAILSLSVAWFAPRWRVERFITMQAGTIWMRRGQAAKSHSARAAFHRPGHRGGPSGRDQGTAVRQHVPHLAGPAA